jgi:[acyl-carrier-protein] S-malonyltransferase
VAITVVSLAVARMLFSRGIKPSACAGFSLGEYPALAVAGVITEADAVRLTLERGRIMQDVCTRLSSSAEAISSAPTGFGSFSGTEKLPAEATASAGMSAVLGLSPAQIDDVIATLNLAGLYAANYNSPLQTVISGTAEALSAAEPAFKAAGARRVIRLKVAGPFQSPLMASAGEAFKAVLDGVRFADPVLPVFSNVTGKRIRDGAEAKKNAVLHISSPVRWTEEESAIFALISAGAAGAAPELVEVGPGKVLSGLWADSKLGGTSQPYAGLLA